MTAIYRACLRRSGSMIVMPVGVLSPVLSTTVLDSNKLAPLRHRPVGGVVRRGSSSAAARVPDGEPVMITTAVAINQIIYPVVVMEVPPFRS